MELLAQVLAGQNRYDDAIELAREVCALNPDAPSSRVVLAGVLMEAGRLDVALQEANAAAEVAPSHARTHSALGAIYVKMNNGTAAGAAFEQMARCLDPSMERLPSLGRVWCDVGRGAALSLLGRHDEAMAAFEEVLRIDQGFFERWPEVASHYQLSSRETERNKQGSRQ